METQFTEIKKLDPTENGPFNTHSNNELIKRLENDFISHFDKFAVEQNKSEPNTDIVRVEKGIWLYIVSLYSHVTLLPEKQSLVDLIKLYDSYLYSKEGDN